jgi:hypothetical protein
MGRNRTALGVLLAMLLVSLIACSRDSDTPLPTTAPTAKSTQSNTPVDPSGDQPALGIAVGEPHPVLSPETLPLRKLTFSVQTPSNTPDNAPVYLSLVDLTGGVDKHIRMKSLGDGVYETQAEVLENAMIRYTYDRFDAEGCCDAFATREAIGELFKTQYRLLLTDPKLTTVNDTVATWVDLRAPHTEGSITVSVTNSATGKPEFDVDVSISGIHVGTRTNGEITVNGLPAGEHKIVVHSDSGDFLPVQQTLTLEDGGTETVAISVSSTTLVPVNFDVLLPESTPDGAWVKLAGNISTLGARIAHPARPLTPDNFFIPLLERNGTNASAEFMLPVGTFIEYFYTIGPIGVTNERAEQGRWAYRNFIVGEDGDHRSDRVKFWNNEGWPLVTLNMTPPVDTPEDAKIALNMGPSSWMERNPDGTYSTVLGTGPVGSEMRYRYLLGDDFNGADASDAANDGQRSFTVKEGGGVITDTVTRWLGQRDPTTRRDDGSLVVTFRLSVPPETPDDTRIFVNGSRPAFGGGITMTPLATNRWIYEAKVEFGHDGPLSYRYEFPLQRPSSYTIDINTDFDGQVTNDWVSLWPAKPRSVELQPGFIKGFYTPDFFSNNFIALSESTYKRILDHQGSAVVVSSVWSYGQTQPIPTLEYRAVQAGSVATPLVEIVEQARIAHESGLEVFFGPQFNMEQAPGGFELYNGPKSDEWWAEWLKLADEMWTWQATVAELIDAEYMMVPGPLFHVYDQIDKPSDDPLIVSFEAEQARLMAKIRDIYSGKLVVTGNPRQYDFPGLADFNGVTTYDLGVPQLPADTTVAEFVDYYEERFTERVDPIFEKWGNPVFFYTIHAPAVPTAGDEAGEIAQANAIEALFQVIAKRPFIKGALTWSYDMIDTPLTPGDGLRGRLGEAVLAKWYSILGG